MKKIVSLIIIVNLVCLTRISYGVQSMPGQRNIELTYKQAILEISKDTNKLIENVIMEDKLSTKKYNFDLKMDKNNSQNYIKLESEKKHEKNEELKAKWKSILKVDYEKELIVDVIYSSAFPEKKILNNYDFEMGSQGYDVNGNSINGYYNNIYMSGIVEFRNKQNYKNYYFTHYLYFCF